MLHTLKSQPQSQMLGGRHSFYQLSRRIRLSLPEDSTPVVQRPLDQLYL